MFTRNLTRIPRSRTFLATSSSASSTAPRTALAVPRTSIRNSSGDHGHDAHESHYDNPGGWLWGIRPGEKYEKEGWENLFYIGFVGSWVVAIAAYTMKEDTSIQTWALEEARRRLEKEGILEDSSK